MLSSNKRHEALLHARARVALGNMLTERTDHRSHMSHKSMYVKCPEEANLEKQRADEWLPGAGEGPDGSNC